MKTKRTVSVREPYFVRNLQMSVAAPTVLLGEHNRRLYVLAPEKIDYVEARGNYVTFSIAGTEYISRDSVKRVAAALAGCGFVRIKKSLLINIAAVSYLQRIGHGIFAFTLRSGSCLRSGAAYRGEILQALPLANAPRFRARQTPGRLAAADQPELESLADLT